MSRPSFRRKRGLHHHPIIGYGAKSAIHRFLEQTQESGCAAPMYHRQWATLFLAEKHGYITGYGGTITIKGRQELTRLNKKEKMVECP